MKKLLMVFLFIAFTIASPSCFLLTQSAQVTKSEKTKNISNKKVTKDYKIAKKEHFKKQSDRTKELIKEAKKQQRKVNHIHQRSLWDRLFNRNCRTGKRIS